MNLTYSNLINALIPLSERIHAALQASHQPHPPAQLPESMRRDEMLKYYSEYANLVSEEALRYQKRIRDLEAALATKEPK